MDLARLLVFSSLVALTACMFYHCAGYWAEYLEVAHDVSERAEFLSIPANLRFGFLRDFVHESRQMMRRGVAFPALLRYLASTTVIRLAREYPSTSLFLIMASLFLFLWFFFGYLTKKAAIDAMAVPILTKHNELAAEKRALKEQARAIRQNQKKSAAAVAVEEETHQEESISMKKAAPVAHTDARRDIAALLAKSVSHPSAIATDLSLMD
jgi:hypothetical protein